MLRQFVAEIERKPPSFNASREHTQIAADAVEVFDAALKIVSKILVQGYKDGVILLEPNLIKYLEQRGAMETERGEAAKTAE